nr:MAG TPA: NrdH [Bacteriophage sp.]
MNKNIILYSTGCPKCEILKKKMGEKNISYTEINDIDIMNEKNITFVPMLEIEGKLLNYRESVSFINSI